MKKHAQAAAQKVKNHVKSNKFAYCMGALAIGAVALQQRNVHEFTKFLIEKGIDPDEYYCPEALEEAVNS